MTQAQVLSDYQLSINKASGLIAAVHATDATGNNLWSIDEQMFITEAAFLKIFIAWEAYLEKSFLQYMMGEPSIGGNIVPRCVSPRDETHANKILIGTQRYFDWADPGKVRSLANLFFDRGEPYETIIASMTSDLVDLRTIRNSAAHISTTTIVLLDGLATRKLQRPCNNISVYDLILAVDPSSGTGERILESYVNLLNAATIQIANA